MDIEQSLQAIKDIYVNASRQTESNKEKLIKVDQEIQDLLHFMEFTSLNASDGYKYYKQLQTARQTRRKIKNELELLEPVKELLSFVKPTEKNINKVLGDVRRIKHQHSTRMYTMRIRSDLQELMK